MFMSENICSMVDFFDKAVAEGVRETLWKGSQKVMTRRDETDRQADRQTDR